MTIGDRSLFVHRAGTGAPTAVLLPGAGAIGLSYPRLILDAAEETSIVAYDRGGTGWSDDVSLPRSAAEVTDELRALLRELQLPAPYVLIGHSLGGGYAMHFARRFPDEVAGLLLLDPLHEDFPRYEPPEMAAITEAFKAQPIVDFPPEVLAMLQRQLAEKYAAWPAEVRESLIAYHSARWRTGIAESSNVEALYDELRRAAPLPDVPLVVLSSMASDPAHAQFVPTEVQEKSMAGKSALNASIAASVPRGEHRELPGATHAWMHVERPDAVQQALRDLLAMVRERRA